MKKEWIHSESAKKSREIECKMNGISLNSVSWYSMSFDSGCGELKVYSQNSLNVSWVNYEFTIYFANSLWIHSFFNSLEIEFRFWEFAIYVAKIPWVHYEFTCCFPNILWIHYLFRGFTMNFLGISRICFEFTINFPNSLWIYYLFREFTIYLANPSWI